MKMKFARLWLPLATMLLFQPVADLGATPAAPLKPYGRLVDEVAAFLLSDVGITGIRTNDGLPDGYPVPPYCYHYGIYDSNRLWSPIEVYPGYYSISYPGYTASVGIDAFLDYYLYSGNTLALDHARLFADWILDHLTPAGDLYGNLPYSTQTDAVMGGGWDGEAIMVDKPAMFGLRLLRLYDMTGEPRYWTGAQQIGATLLSTQVLSGEPQDYGRWYFRVRPSDGLVTQPYTSHLQPMIRFFEAMAPRTGDPAYQSGADAAFAWLLANPCNPASSEYMRWEAFYEDQSPEMQTGLRDHYSAHEMIVELTRRRPAGWQQLCVDIMDWIKSTYLVETAGTYVGDYYPCTLEWSGWPHATPASTMQFARTSLLLYDALAGDPLQAASQHDLAAGMALVCTYAQNTRAGADDGRMFTTIRDIVNPYNNTSWYEQNFNVVKYYLQMMAIDPTFAPDDQMHLLSRTTEITEIIYGAIGLPDLSPPTVGFILYSTVDGTGEETLRLPSIPLGAIADGVELPYLEIDDGLSNGWFWDGTLQLARVRHSTDPVEMSVTLNGQAEVSPAADSLFSLRRVAGGLAAFELELSVAGRVSVAVFDLRGRRVATPVVDREFPAGMTPFTWDGRDRGGRLAASGVYLLRATSAGRAAVSRVVVSR